jgi:MFS family permease
VIAAGALGCVLGGILGDRWGRPQAAGLAMTLSGGCALLAGFVYSGPVWLLVAVSLVWGITVVADSAQFSAMVTDMGDPRYVGTTLTLQLGLGFSLTVAPSGSCRCWPASSRVGSGSFSFSCPVQRWASSPCSAYVRPASGVSYVPSMVPTCASVRTRPNRAIDRLRLVAPPARNRVAPQLGDGRFITPTRHPPTPIEQCAIRRCRVMPDPWRALILRGLFLRDRVRASN